MPNTSLALYDARAGRDQRCEVTIQHRQASPISRPSPRTRDTAHHKLRSIRCYAYPVAFVDNYSSAMGQSPMCKF
jgi:hypothetical protein